MKCPKATKAVKTEKVAPFAGAWIEIRMKRMSVLFNDVAPFAGAWIEIAI